MVKLEVGVAAVVLGNHRCPGFAETPESPYLAEFRLVPAEYELLENVYIRLELVVELVIPQVKIAISLLPAEPNTYLALVSEVALLHKELENVYFSANDVAVPDDVYPPAM